MINKATNDKAKAMIIMTTEFHLKAKMSYVTSNDCTVTSWLDECSWSFPLLKLHFYCCFHSILVLCVNQVPRFLDSNQMHCRWVSTEIVSISLWQSNYTSVQSSQIYSRSRPRLGLWSEIHINKSTVSAELLMPWNWYKLPVHSISHR